MKNNASKSAPLGGILWKDGAKSFIHKGTNGRWQNILSNEEIDLYRNISIEKLGAKCANWLELGKQHIDQYSFVELNNVI